MKTIKIFEFVKRLVDSIKGAVGIIKEWIADIKSKTDSLTSEQRNQIGMVLWSIAALVFGIVVLPIMVAREYYQFKKYLVPVQKPFEYMDVVTYGLFIVIFSIFHWCIFDLLISKCAWWLFL